MDTRAIQRRTASDGLARKPVMSTSAGVEASAFAPAPATPFSLERLQAVLKHQNADGLHPTAAQRLAELHACGLDQIPLPGHGATLQRWQALAAVGHSDLSLGKLYEGHTDAVAILAELGAAESHSAGCLWGVWAAEAPAHRLVVSEAKASGVVSLCGSKAWCSGADSVSHALMTAWYSDGRGPQLVRIATDQPNLSMSADDWKAVAMAQSAGLTVTLNHGCGRPVGAPGSYLDRPGFWHGGAGVAACWYGGALAIANTLRRAVRDSGEGNASGFQLAALGKVDLAMRSCAALLREASTIIDAAPSDDSRAVVLRVRQAAEACCHAALDEVGRALGAAPFCRDRHFARMATDLPVFIRQSHAERDYCALGEQIAELESEPWQL